MPVQARSAVAILAALTVAGCASPATPTPSGTSAPANPATTASEPLTINNCGRDLVFNEVPSRVVILSGMSVAEVSTFVALGIEDSIVANLQGYEASDNPELSAQIAALPDGGINIDDNLAAPAEQVLALEPDLVISTYGGGFDASTGTATREELADVGANSYVTPTRCAIGNPDASDEDAQQSATVGVEASFELMRQLGQIFDVEERAESVVAQMESELQEVGAAIADREPKRGIVLTPGMASEVPAAWTGPIYDDILARAGVKNVFEGQGEDKAGTFSAEQLLTENPEVVVLFGMGSADTDTLRAAIEQQFPSWPAVRNGVFVTSHDGIYLGPNNAIAVKNIALAAHPDAW